MKNKRIMKIAIPICAVFLVLICVACGILIRKSLTGYYITVEKTLHGTLQANKKRAEANETITLQCTADEGYILKQVMVNGEVLEEMSFSMPEENVLVEAKFVPESDTNRKSGVHAEETPGAIVYEALFPSGEAYKVSWDFIYEEDGLAATAWVEGEPINGDGVVLYLAKEKVGARGGLNYLPDDTWRISCEYQKESESGDDAMSIMRADADGNMAAAEANGITAEINDWEEKGQVVGYCAKIKADYATLGYTGKTSAMASLTLLAGNRVNVIAGAVGEYWLDGEYNFENYLTYPRLISDNTLQDNRFEKLTDIELDAYRDIGVILDGVISPGEYKGRKLTDISVKENFKISVQGHLTSGKNIRIAVEIEHKTAPDTVVNPYPGLSQFLFAEFGFGENTGNGDCTLVKANVLGKAENAAIAVKTTDNGAGAKYRYKTIIEMWIPKTAITNNTNENSVRITRLALFHEKDTLDPGINFVVAKFVDLNNCNVTANGIKMDGEVDVPESEAVGLDGVISAGEYKGTTLTDTSANGNYKISVQGHLTADKNIRLAVKIDSKVSPQTVVNEYSGLGKYLFAECGFGENTGEDCTLVKANVLGEAENAATVVKTTENSGAEYRYSTVIEMWIPKTSITNNTNEDNVRITRLALFHEKDAADPGINFLVAKFVGLNNCSVTANGIKKEGEVDVPDDAISGLDGIISEGEYQGKVMSDTSANNNYKISVQGHLTTEKDIRLAITVDAKTAPETVVNPYPGLSQYLFAEMGFGENIGNGDCTLVKANVRGEAENAKTKVVTTDNGKDAEYRYTTVIEMHVPKSVITNNTDEDNVRITRFALFHETAEGDSGVIWLVAKFVNLNNCSVTANGIKKEGEVDVPDDATSGLDGVISPDEYRGAKLEATSNNKNYKMSVQGHLTAEKDIRLALRIDAKTAPETEVNPYPDMSQYLFVEFRFGDNDGLNGTLVKVNVLGQAENAKTVVKTTDNGEDAEYRYTTVIEMHVPKSAITNNTDEDNVRITRLFLFHEKDPADPGIIFLVAKWANLYPECEVTADGIKKDGSEDVPDDAASGLDGVISEGEYRGTKLESTSDKGNYKMSVQGYLTEDKDIRLALKIDAKTAPETVVNPYPDLSQYLFAEFGFGENNGNGDCTLVKANVLGKAENAETAVKTTDNGEDAEYRYTTVIEMQVPKSAITNNTDENNVRITRLFLFHESDPADNGINFVVARFAGLNNCSVTAEGIVLQ